MKIFPLLTLFGGATLGVVVLAQDHQDLGGSVEGSIPTVEAPRPVTVTDASAIPRTDKPTTDQAHGEAVLLEAGFEPLDHDDSIPLPVEALVQSGDGGDSVVDGASGDPFFLGFARGKHYPQADELVDPQLTRLTSFADGRPNPETYAFVMFNKRITPERVDQLEALGCRELGFHPHYTMKVAIPVDRIGEVSTLDFVRWVGTAQDWQKTHPALDFVLEQATGSELVPVYLSVFESDMNEMSRAKRIGRVSVTDPGRPEYEPTEDQRAQVWMSNGWQQHALEARGFVVESYAQGLHTFRGKLPADRLSEVLSLDFVQFVEPVPEYASWSAAHDESTAMISADRVRATHNGGTSQLAIVGVVDSGIEVSHTDLGIWGVGWDCSGLGTWDDSANGGNGHGTHVAGTIMGRGVTEFDQQGCAPGLASWGGLGRAFNVRMFPTCSWAVDTTTGIMNTPFNDGANITPKPHVINNSWGSFFTNGTNPTGTEFDARTLDSAVYNNEQLWVFSAGNGGSGAGTVTITGGAKNVLTVGSVIDYEDAIGDPGELWTSSSRGPMADNRWKPSLSAPGRIIRSCLANDLDGYAGYSGTSMSAPHVTAAGATLVDHYSWTAYDPELQTTMLMANSIVRNDATISTASSSLLDTYGVGRIDSYRSHWLVGSTYSNWNFTQGSTGYSFGDFTIPANCTRLIAVMNYNEAPASSGASQALVNDLDFYLDQPPVDTANGNTGEWFAQQSSIDNTEIRILTNPLEGSWRWKCFPDSVSSTCKVAVTIVAFIEDTTPDGTLVVTADDSCIAPGQSVNITATVSPDEYLASAVIMEKSGSSHTLLDTRTTLQDGVLADLNDNVSAGHDIILGDIIDFSPRNGTWEVSYATEGTKSFTVDMRSDNMLDKNATVFITVDGTPPSTVSNLSSPSHTVNQWSNDSTIDWTWNAATDSVSGVQGYGIFEFTSCSIPGQTLDIGNVTSHTSAAYGSSTAGRYFNIISVDNCGNWDTTNVCAGPYFIDVTVPSNPGSLTSSSVAPGVPSCDTGVSATWASGSDSHSGVNGYSVVWTTSATTLPNTSVNTTGNTSSVTLPVGSWYLHVRTRDNAGNWASSASHFGPFIVTATCGTNYCGSVVNSTGSGGVITATGSDDASDNNLLLTATNLPTGQFGYFLTSQSQGFTANPGGSQGNLCLGGQIGRYTATGQIFNTGGSGMGSLALNLNQTPTPGGLVSITAGQTWFWTAWFRDFNPGSTSNFTDAVRVTFH